MLLEQTEEELLQLWCVFCAVTKVGDEMLYLEMLILHCCVTSLLQKAAVVATSR